MGKPKELPKSDSEAFLKFLEGVLQPSQSKDNLLSCKQLQTLTSFIEEMSKTNKLSTVTPDILIQLTRLLQENTETGLQMKKWPFDNVERRVKEATLAVDSAWMICRVLTTHNLPPLVHIGDAIGAVVKVVARLIVNVVLPISDPAYLKTSGAVDDKEKAGVKVKSPKKTQGYQQLYRRVMQTYHLLAEYLTQRTTAQPALEQLLVDTSVTVVSACGLKEMHATALRMLLLLNASLHRLAAITDKLLSSPSLKRCFALGSGMQISTCSATLLCLVQSSVKPELDAERGSHCIETAANIVLSALAKLTSRGTLFQLLIDDWSTASRTTEFPGAEFMLGKLGCFVLGQASNKRLEPALRLTHCDSLGHLVARLRQDESDYDSKSDSLQRISAQVKAKQLTSQLLGVLLESYAKDDLVTNARSVLLALWHPVACKKPDKRSGSGVPHTVEDLTLIGWYLGQNRAGHRSVDWYIAQMVALSGDALPAMRARVLCSLRQTCVAQPSLLRRARLRQMVCHAAQDPAPAVREAALLLIAKVPAVMADFVAVINAAIQEAGPAARPAIRLLTQMAPAPHLYCAALARLEDDDATIRRLVEGVMADLWFTPLPQGQEGARTTAVIETARMMTATSQQHHFQTLIARMSDGVQQLAAFLASNVAMSRDRIGSLAALYLMAGVQPQLMLPHLSIIVDIALQSHVVEPMCVKWALLLLELVLPVAHLNPKALTVLEKHLIQFLSSAHIELLSCSLACLGVIAVKSTWMAALFAQCCATIERHSATDRAELHRAMIIAAGLMRYFPVEFFADCQLVEECVAHLSTACDADSAQVQCWALRALGQASVRHAALPLRLVRTHRLALTGAPWIKMEALNNLALLLTQPPDAPESELLKEMSDGSGSVASSVIQLLLKDILEAYLDRQLLVRQAAAGLVHLVLSQGLVDLAPMVAYLIAMTTDDCEVIGRRSRKDLSVVNVRYPSYVHMKAAEGVLVTFKLQSLLQQEAVRGFKKQQALMTPLYSLLQPLKKRTSLLLSMLKPFESERSHMLLLFLADNLGNLSFTQLDEVLFLVLHIDIIVCIEGANLMEDVNQCLLAADAEEAEEATAAQLLARIPTDTTAINVCLDRMHGCRLLLQLKAHLKPKFAVNDRMVSEYSSVQCNAGKSTPRDKMARKSNAVFQPRATSPQTKRDTAAIVDEIIDFQQMLLQMDEVTAVREAPAAQRKSRVVARRKQKSVGRSMVKKSKTI